MRDKKVLQKEAEMKTENTDSIARQIYELGTAELPTGAMDSDPDLVADSVADVLRDVTDAVGELAGVTTSSLLGRAAGR
jgi:hypothetical protein